MSTSCGWEGKGRYGSFRGQLKLYTLAYTNTNPNPNPMRHC